MNTCFATSRLGSSPRDPRWPGNPSSTTHPADDSPFRSVNVWETGKLSFCSALLMFSLVDTHLGHAQPVLFISLCLQACLGLLFPGSKQEQHEEAIDPHQETSRCFTFFFLVASKRSTWKRTAD
ncbi:hypothetical protein EJB05_49462, partial [Eragrostis curvula]